MLFVYLFVGFLIVLGLVFVGLYNGLIGKRNRVDESLSSVDVMLKKRFDLIPNLVGAVDRYMDHESGVLRELTALRARAMTGDLSAEERAEVDRATSAALGQLMIQVEAYPDLKASENFLQLQAALNEIEEQLSAARRTYNAVVTEFNNAIEMVPSNIVAGMMNLARRPYFEVDEGETATPDVGALFGDRT